MRGLRRNGPIGIREADGVAAHKSRIGESDHPVCGTKVGYAEIFLMPQPPLLTRRGIRPFTVHRPPVQ